MPRCTMNCEVPWRARTRDGFTLMEIVLVLGILVAVAAMAAPIFNGTVKRERLRKGIELIAADWTETRAAAMQTGETQLWYAQVDSDSYSSGAYSQQSSSGAGALGQMADGVSLVPTAIASGEDAGQSLPMGVTISEVRVTESDMLGTMSQTTTSGEGGVVTLFFYPDGTSSSARLTVTNEEEQTMTAVMNGVAGTVRVMDGRELANE